MLIGVELSGIKNIIICSISKVLVEFLLGGFNEHIVHEKSVVRSGAYNSDSYSLLLVVACISINDVKSLSGVKVVSRQILKDLE